MLRSLNTTRGYRYRIQKDNKLCYVDVDQVVSGKWWPQRGPYYLSEAAPVTCPDKVYLSQTLSLVETGFNSIRILVVVCF